MGSPILLVLTPQATLLRRGGELAEDRGARCPLGAKMWGPETEAIGIQGQTQRREMGVYTHTHTPLSPAHLQSVLSRLGISGLR